MAGYYAVSGVLLLKDNVVFFRNCSFAMSDQIVPNHTNKKYRPIIIVRLDEGVGRVGGGGDICFYFKNKHVVKFDCFRSKQLLFV